MGMRDWGTGIVLVLLVWGMLTLTCAAEPSRVSSWCPAESVTDSILGVQDSNCPLNGDSGSLGLVGVTEGDEVSLQRALNIVHKNSLEYVAVLFYASWCPFSRTFRPSFSILSSLYPSIPHFAIEESAVRPSILSKYGVHGFPTLFLLNSTMRVRYHGFRTLASLVAFYSDVTGIKLHHWIKYLWMKLDTHQIMRSTITPIRKAVHSHGQDLQRNCFGRRHIWLWPPHLCFSD